MTFLLSNLKGEKKQITDRQNIKALTSWWRENNNNSKYQHNNKINLADFVSFIGAAKMPRLIVLIAKHCTHT